MLAVVIILLIVNIVLTVTKGGEDSKEAPTPTAIATPVPTTADAATPTDAPTPTNAPTDVQTPTEAATKEYWLVGPDMKSNKGALAVNQVVFYDENSKVRVYVRRTQEDTANLSGTTIGGIGLDTYTPDPSMEFKLAYDPAKGEEFYFEYTLRELKEAAKASESKKLTFVIKDDLGYTLFGV